jgi:hypothetical protein
MTDDFQRLLTCADDGGRVIILCRTRRMPFGASVYGYLNPIQCSRRGVCPLGLRGCEIAHLWALVYPKMALAGLSGKRKGLKSVVHVGRPGGEIY